jgi:hypothetical protein
MNASRPEYPTPTISKLALAPGAVAPIVAVEPCRILNPKEFGLFSVKACACKSTTYDPLINC